MAKNVKEQIVMSEDESQKFAKEAKKQDRSKSNLGRLYILDGLRKDEKKNGNN
jgi:hypothetical protein